MTMRHPLLLCAALLVGLSALSPWLRAAEFSSDQMTRAEALLAKIRIVAKTPETYPITPMILAAEDQAALRSLIADLEPGLRDKAASAMDMPAILTALAWLSLDQPGKVFEVLPEKFSAWNYDHKRWIWLIAHARLGNQEAVNKLLVARAVMSSALKLTDDQMKELRLELTIGQLNRKIAQTPSGELFMERGWMTLARQGWLLEDLSKFRHPALSMNQRARQLREARQADSVAKAMADFDQAEKLDVKDVFYIAAGRWACAVLQGRKDQALEICQKMIAGHPRHPIPPFFKALTGLQFQDKALAEAAMKQCHAAGGKLDPDFIDAVWMLP